MKLGRWNGLSARRERLENISIFVVCIFFWCVLDRVSVLVGRISLRVKSGRVRALERNTVNQQRESVLLCRSVACGVGPGRLRARRREAE